MIGTAVVFQPGHRIRVDITSSNFPQFDRNLNTGDPLGKGTQPRVAQQTIHHSAAKPSAIVSAGGQGILTAFVIRPSAFGV